MNKRSLVIFSLALGALLLPMQMVMAQCPYWDSDYNEPTMFLGGEAVSTALATLTFAVPDDFEGELDYSYPGRVYYWRDGSLLYVSDLPLSLELPFRLWDFDGNSIPDKVQLELLTELLCLPEGVQHPLIDIAALREAMMQNEAEVWDLIAQLFSIEEVEMGTAQLLLDSLGDQMKTNWATAGISNPITTPIDDPLIFSSGSIPEKYQGVTWLELADLFIGVSDAFINLLDNWEIAESALNNSASVQLLAAVFGLLTDDGWSEIMEMDFFADFEMAMLLDEFDWTYLCNKFGITDPSAEELGNAVNALELSPGLMPSQATTEVFAWGSILDTYTSEGEFVDDMIGDSYFATFARVVQASPDAPELGICQNGVALFDTVQFKEVTPYSPVTAPYPDFTYGFSSITAGGDCGAGVPLADVDLPNTFTVVTLNTYYNLESLVLDDNVAAPVNGKAKLRFVNASPDAGALDVVAGAQTLFANVPFKGVGAFIEVLPGAYTVDFISAGKDEKALPPADIVLNSGSVYTLYAMGLAESVEVEIIEDVQSPDLVSVDSPERKAYFTGESFELTAQVDPSAAPSAYAWYRDGVLLESAEPTLTIENAGPGDSGRYTVVVTVDLEGKKAVTQLSDTTDLIMVYAAPEVSIAGVSSVKFGEPINLSASLASFDPVGLTDSYAWTQDGAPVSTTADLSIAYADDDMDGDACSVTVTVALADYPEITRTVYAGRNLAVALPTVSISGKSVVEIMNTITLAATISGAGTTPLEYTYAWTYNTDGNVQEFSNESTMVRENATPGFTGTYKVSVILSVAAQLDISAVISDTQYVRVTEEEMPASGMLGLAVAAALCALSGGAFLKRKK